MLGETQWDWRERARVHMRAREGARKSRSECQGYPGA
jgi:hypothetical protein